MPWLAYRDDSGRVHLVTEREAAERLVRCSFHEAGHAVVALATRARVKRVLVDDVDAFTTAEHRRSTGPPIAMWELQRSFAIVCGGYLAERRAIPHTRHWARRCARTDLRDAAELFPRGSRAWRDGVRSAGRLVRAHWPLVVALSAELRARRELLEPALLDLAARHGIDVSAIPRPISG